MSQQKEKHVLPADVFDALELSALVHGGIGAGCLSKTVEDAGNGVGIEVPSCVIGHALFLDGYNFEEQEVVPKKSPVCDALVKAFPLIEEELEEAKLDARAYSVDETHQIYQCAIGRIETENDDTVRTYSSQYYAPTLTWKQWTKRMNVVRGEK